MDEAGLRHLFGAAARVTLAKSMSAMVILSAMIRCGIELCAAQNPQIRDGS